MKNNIFFLRMGGIVIDVLFILIISMTINIALLLSNLVFIKDTEIYSQGRLIYFLFSIFYFF